MKTKIGQIEHLRDRLKDMSMLRMNKDSNGIFTNIRYLRPDETVYAISQLSGGTSPQYTRRDISYMDKTGLVMLESEAFNLIYDGDGDLTSEVSTLIDTSGW